MRGDSIQLYVPSSSVVSFVLSLTGIFIYSSNLIFTLSIGVILMKKFCILMCKNNKNCRARADTILCLVIPGMPVPTLSILVLFSTTVDLKFKGLLRKAVFL